jgi:hypothetical protein
MNIRLHENLCIDQLCDCHTRKDPVKSHLLAHSSTLWIIHCGVLENNILFRLTVLFQ